MVNGGTLYTREVLALATSLSQWPHDAGMPFQGAARSATCGSSLALSLAVDGAGRITGIGLRPQACAIGQASAALFAQGAIGQDAEAIATQLEAIRQWLKNGAAMPGWPGFSAIAAARDYPARHGAITLPWEAALVALCSTAKPG